ncbi:alpha/beta fold hydrolase [Thermomonospora umbrina]|uniref:Pimeloyl-ACP methyl ester carboxylesterase n=1 Tax=Thermomonospora umbrina TaxID=111806 RepID=A0A3D9SKS5_9ACTN|nr:alpha/beta hydrolase [Thermomonospora umbrina]REE96532.1 pimeloyl-ACP methyl ester carboxylesterase [Thermomonospora umbrina]
MTTALVATSVSGTATAESPSTDRTFPGLKPTVVLVHGAFTDASSWHGVIGHLQRHGYPVVAPANPLRDLAADSAYIAGVVRGIKGPVILAGHSYGGAVITNAARSATNVKGLVYVAGFAPDEGESAGSIDARYPKTPLKDSITPLPHEDGTVDLSIAPEKFPGVFAPHVPRSKAAQMAAAQRPIAVAAIGGRSGRPAWRSLPSWFLIPSDDRALHPDAQADMAERAHARKTVWIEGGHAVTVSRPSAVAELLRVAARDTRDR